MIDATEVLPRLWIGTCASCDEARRQGFFCMNMLEGKHTEEPGCLHKRIIADDGKIDIGDLMAAARMIDWTWANASYPGTLVHCGAGVERSPLTVAIWMTTRFAVSLDQAYDWLKRHRPQVEDRRFWIRGAS